MRAFVKETNKAFGCALAQAAFPALGAGETKRRDGGKNQPIFAVDLDESGPLVCPFVICRRLRGRRQTTQVSERWQSGLMRTLGKRV